MFASQAVKVLPADIPVSWWEVLAFNHGTGKTRIMTDDKELKYTMELFNRYSEHAVLFMFSY